MQSLKIFLLNDLKLGICSQVSGIINAKSPPLVNKLIDFSTKKE